MTKQDLERIDDEIHDIFGINHGFSTKQLRDRLMKDTIDAFDGSMTYTTNLHWDEKIDDKQFEERKTQHRNDRDQDLAEIFTWYDWVVEGRP
jgi:hypothetical protein